MKDKDRILVDRTNEHIKANHGKSSLVAVSMSNETAGRNRKVRLFCSTCAKDPELFGDGYFTSLIGDIKRGQIPCGCSKSPNWTQDQYKTLNIKECK